MFKRYFKRLVPLQFYREKQTVENKLLRYGGDRCRVWAERIWLKRNVCVLYLLCKHLEIWIHVETLGNLRH